MRYRIREIRKTQKMTRLELAEKSGISRATISTLEKKQNQTSTSKTLLSIARALGVSVDQLIEE